MEDERTVASSGFGVTPEAVVSRTFTTSFRGYDQAEVRTFLQRVSEELAAAAEREAQLRRLLQEAQAKAAHPEVDEELLTNALGEYAARLLATAREQAAAIRSEAEARAARLIREAEAQMGRIRADADGLLARRVEEVDAVTANLRSAAEADARVLREQAKADAEAELQAARSQGREMIAEARAVRERILADLARRRHISEVQLEQLRAARERLLSAYSLVRRTLDEATEELKRAETEARMAADDVARRAPPPPPPPPPPPHAESGDDTEPGVRRHESWPVPATSSASAVPPGVGTGAPPPSSAPPSPSPPAPWSPPASSPHRTAAAAPTRTGRTEPRHRPPARPGEARPSSPSRRPSELGPPPTAPPPARRPARESGVPASSTPSAPPGPASPTGLATPPPPAPPAPPSMLPRPVAPPPLREPRPPAESPPAPRPSPESDRVNELFARIKADRAGAVVAAMPSEPAPPVIEEPPPAEPTDEGAQFVDERPPPPAPAAPADVTGLSHVADETARSHRDELLEPIEETLARQLKRALQDEQNEVLDRLRRKRRRRGAPILPDPEEQVGRFREVAESILGDAVRAGVRFADSAASEAHADEGSAQAVADGLAREIAEPLHARLQRSVSDGGEEGDGDREGESFEISERISAVYRQWRAQEVEPLARHHAVTAFNLGAFAAYGDGVRLRWVVEDEGPCPDCDDNSLAGAVMKGDRYPTGQLHPPAHPGCRCLLVAAVP